MVPHAVEVYGVFCLKPRNPISTVPTVPQKADPPGDRPTAYIKDRLFAHRTLVDP